MSHKITTTKMSPAEYQKILEKMPIPCVEAVIQHNGKVLLIRRAEEPVKGYWWFPGGRIYKKERLKEAVLRKAYEETGLNVEIQKLIGAYNLISNQTPFPNAKSGSHAVIIDFLVVPKEKNPKPRVDNTISDYKWIDGIEGDLHPHVKKVLKDSKLFD